MADEGKSKRLLAAAAAAGGVGAMAGVGALGRKADEKAVAASRKQLVQESFDREAVNKANAAKGPGAKALPEKDPTRNLSPRQSKEFRAISQKKRLSVRAQAARARGLGTKTLGAAGVALNTPEAVESARSVTAEGGPYAARFGKFVERILGVAPSQYLPRPPTDEERTIEY